VLNIPGIKEGEENSPHKKVHAAVVKNIALLLLSDPELNSLNCDHIPAPPSPQKACLNWAGHRYDIAFIIAGVRVLIEIKIAPPVYASEAQIK